MRCREAQFKMGLNGRDAIQGKAAGSLYDIHVIATFVRPCTSRRFLPTPF